MAATAPGPNRAFTLIELLVVLAIASLLIAMLLPALTEARQQAIRIVCMTQVRTLFSATLGYANDNEGALPYAGAHTWRNALPASSRVLLKQYGANNDSFFCPSAADRFTKASWNYARSDTYVDQGYNLVSYMYFGGWTSWNASQIDKGRPTNRYSWPDGLMSDNGTRRYYNETAPTLRFQDHERLSDRPIWIDNAIRGKTYEGTVNWQIPANNHIREFKNTSIGQHVGYADGHAIWMSDPHNTRRKRYTYNGATATVTIHW